MNLGSVFNFLWIATILAMVFKDVWVGLGFTARQVAFAILGMVAVGLLVGWLGMLKLFVSQRNKQGSEKPKGAAMMMRIGEGGSVEVGAAR